MHLKGKGIGYDRGRRCPKPGKSEWQSNKIDSGKSIRTNLNFIYLRVTGWKSQRCRSSWSKENGRKRRRKRQSKEFERKSKPIKQQGELKQPLRVVNWLIQLQPRYPRHLHPRLHITGRTTPKPGFRYLYEMPTKYNNMQTMYSSNNYISAQAHQRTNFDPKLWKQGTIIRSETVY